MRRRLTLAIVGVVAGALAVAGLGSLLLVRRATANQTRVELATQGEQVAAQTGTVLADQPGVISLIQRVARLDSAEIVVLTPAGGVSVALPSGLTVNDIHPDLLAAGKVVSAVHGTLAYAAVPVQLTETEIAAGLAARAGPARNLARAAQAGATPVVVVTRQVAGPAGGWYFAVTAAATLLVAVVVADRLGRRISRPLAEVETAARRVAEGDLDARAELIPGDYPELASLGSSINTMTESLARAKGLERQFLMSVSHDLRTPLTSIKGWAEAITDGATDDVRAATIISAEANRLQRLVQDLLDLAKLDARNFSIDVRPWDVVGPVMLAVDGVRPAADEVGLRVEVELPEGPTEAKVDPDRLTQLVANLLDNAYKYAGGRIKVWVAPTAEAVSIAVEDDGPGIAPDEVDRVFERLYQSVRTPARQGGSGLGLTIVKELTEAMGGRVRVESPATAQGGTRIVVTVMR